jgi:hypothetical protein
VVICGLSLAINKVILVAEVVKSQIKNLHQTNNIDCLISNDKFDHSIEKMVPKLEIILSKVEPKNKGTGYQKPMSEADFNKLKTLKNLREDYDKECNESDGNSNGFEIKDKKPEIKLKKKKLTEGYRRKGPKFRIRPRK